MLALLDGREERETEEREDRGQTLPVLKRGPLKKKMIHRLGISPPKRDFPAICIQTVSRFLRNITMGKQ